MCVDLRSIPMLVQYDARFFMNTAPLSVLVAEYLWTCKINIAV